MKKVVFIIMLMLILNNVFTKAKKLDEDLIKNVECIENLDFKQKFNKLMYRIDVIVLKKFDKDSIFCDSKKFDNLEYSLFRNLDTISYYSKSVSYTKLFDFSFGYKSLEHYYSDKRKWLMFYEDNKCNNLIWLDTLKY